MATNGEKVVVLGAFIGGLITGLGVTLLLKKKTEIVEITETGEERPVKRITTWTTI